MQLLTVDQVAERLSTTKRAVVAIIKHGLLAWIDVSITKNSMKPRKRILESDLIAFIESRKQLVTAFNRSRRARRHKERNSSQ